MAMRDSVLRVFIADDDFITREFLDSSLKKWGFEVISAKDGNEAMEELLKEDSPDLVILDWIMPGIEGIEICRKLRKSKKHDSKYLIMLTSFDSTEKIVEGLKAGANDYVTKPFNYEEMKARVEVGKRVIELQNAHIEREKFRAAVEMAGGVCHEFNQPLQIIVGYTDFLLSMNTVDNPDTKPLSKIKEAVEKLGNLTRKLQNITRIKTKDYIGSRKIVDIEGSSKD